AIRRDAGRDDEGEVGQRAVLRHANEAGAHHVVAALAAVQALGDGGAGVPDVAGGHLSVRGAVRVAVDLPAQLSRIEPVHDRQRIAGGCLLERAAEGCQLVGVAAPARPGGDPSGGRGVVASEPVWASSPGILCEFPGMLAQGRNDAGRQTTARGADPFSYLSVTELRRFTRELQPAPGQWLVDAGCGRGGPGLWVAAATGARIRR